MKISKKIYFIIGLIVLFIVGVLSIQYYKQHDQNEIIRVTREWANVSSFPEHATITLIEKEGSTFSREFHVRFTAPEDEIRKWLSDSPGMSTILPEIEEGVETYSIKPSGGAQFAQVIYDTKSNKIVIRVYWS